MDNRHLKARSLAIVTALAIMLLCACSSSDGGPAGGDPQPDTSAGGSTTTSGNAGGSAPDPGTDAPGVVDSGSPADSGAAAKEAGNAGLPFGATCTMNTQCATGLCYSFNAKGMHCTSMCTAGCAPPSTGCNNMGICKVP